MSEDLMWTRRTALWYMDKDKKPVYLRAEIESMDRNSDGDGWTVKLWSHTPEGMRFLFTFPIAGQLMITYAEKGRLDYFEPKNVIAALRNCQPLAAGIHDIHRIADDGAIVYKLTIWCILDFLSSVEI